LLARLDFLPFYLGFKNQGHSRCNIVAGALAKCSSKNGCGQNEGHRSHDDPWGVAVKNKRND